MKLNILTLSIMIPICVLIVIVVFYTHWLVKPDFKKPYGIQVEELIYQGTIEEVFPLYALICFPQKKSGMPVVVIMHEYSSVNDRYSMIETAWRFAKRGFFVIVPDMRGRGKWAESNLVQYNIKQLKIPLSIKRTLGKIYLLLSRFSFFLKPSSGKRDSSGKEIHDIIDSVEKVKLKYSEYIDSSNINIVGYSGGGGNVMAVVGKAPDYFNVAVSYFGISDYQKWYESIDDRKIKEQIIQDIGGKPDEKLLKYKARKAMVAALNNQYTSIHMFVDEEDVITDLEQSSNFKKKTINSRLHVSTAKDAIRYRHGNPSNISDLVKSEDIFVPSMYKNSSSIISRDKEVFLTSGFFFYRGITIILGEGDDTVFKIEWIKNEDIINLKPICISGSKKGKIILRNSSHISVYENHRRIESERATNRFSISSGHEYQILQDI